jgi:bifunctional non-homologous end joining protein LigD
LFVQPRVIVEVEFSNWTKDRMLRHPVYKGLRTDLDPREVLLEGASPGPSRPQRMVTPDHGERQRPRRDPEGTGKVLYPEIAFTSDEMVDYYRTLADVLVSHLAGRPTLLCKYPSGVREPAISSTRDPIDDVSDLIDCAKDDGVEFHTALNRRDDPTTPTAMVFVLVPEESASMRECCRVAIWLGEVLRTIALESFVKTSGTGELEVYVPLNTPTEYEQTESFARAIAELLETHHPDDVVCRKSSKARRGKVFVACSANDPGEKRICVYSLRGTHRPAVSTPLSWEEVEHALASRHAPQLDAEPAVILERVRQNGDLFAPVLELTQRLPEP